MTDKTNIGGANLSGGEGSEIRTGDIDASVTAGRDIIIYNYHYAAQAQVSPPAPSEAEADESLPDNPYRGLFTFRPEHAHLFFGRESFTAQLVTAVESRRLVTVLGASGSGKSSVVFAGLVPELVKQPGKSWLFTTFNPGKDPFYKLAQALVLLLESDLGDIAQIHKSEEIANRLRANLSLLPAYLDAIHQNHPDHHFLIIVDQFEELYTHCRDSAPRQRFLNLLLEILNVPVTSRSSTRLILTLRADFLGQASHHRPFSDALQDTIELLGPMTRKELTKTITEPAALHHVTFEDQLVERLLDDVGREEGSLPLLEFALTELWRHQRSKALTHTAYEAIGRVGGALSNYATKVYNALDTKEKNQARRIFMQLVNPGAGTEDTRRRAIRNDLLADWSLVAKLATERLVVTTSRSKNSQGNEKGQDNEETVELVHEALIRHWQQLRDWIDEDREFLSWRLTLRADLERWEETERDNGALLRGAPLAIARGKLNKWSEDLSSREQEYIQASIDLEERRAAEKEAQRQQEIEQQRELVKAKEKRVEEQAQAADKLRKAAIVIGIACVVAFILAILAVRFGIQSEENADRANIESTRAIKNAATAQAASTAAIAAQETAEANASEAKRQARLARSRELAVAAADIIDEDLDLGLLLATYAFSEATTIEAENILRQALRASRLQFSVVASNGAVFDVAFSPDGQRLATAGENGAVKIWDATSGRELHNLSETTSTVRSLAFNPQGTHLAAANEDGAIILWDTPAYKKRNLLPAHTKEIFDLAFSPDGTRLATASADTTVNLWDVASSQELLSLTNSITGTRGVTFSPDGRHIAVAWNDGTVDIYDFISEDKIITLSGHTLPVNDVIYSPDSEQLVTTSDDATIIIWDSSTGNILRTLVDTSPVYGASYSPLTGKYLVTSNLKGEIKLWDVKSGRELFNFADELVSYPAANDVALDNNWSFRIQFSPDGTRVATSSADGRVKVWRVFGSESIMVLGGHTGRVRNVAFSPNGQRLATASWDHTVKVWDVKSGRELFALVGHQDTLDYVIFNSDGTRLVTGSYDETVKIWDAGSGRELYTLATHPTGVHDVSLSPDDTSIVTTGLDGTIKVWNAASGALLETWQAHSDPLGRAIFNPSGTLLATAGHDKLVKLWDTENWKVQRTLVGHTAGVDGAAFSPDGQFLATVGWDNTARLWDSTTGEELFELTGHTENVGDVAFSPDGTLIATASEDKTVKLWDTISGDEILTLFGHLDRVNEVAFSPDGTHLAASGDDGVVLVYLLDDSELLNLARTRLKRPLTIEECQKYFRKDICPSP